MLQLNTDEQLLLSDIVNLCETLGYTYSLTATVATRTPYVVKFTILNKGNREKEFALQYSYVNSYRRLFSAVKEYLVKIIEENQYV
jgi:hypothetical protein